MNEREFNEWADLLEKFLKKGKGIIIPEKWLKEGIRQIAKMPFPLRIDEKTLLSCFSSLKEVHIKNIGVKIFHLLLNSEMFLSHMDSRGIREEARRLSDIMADIIFKKISRQNFYSRQRFIAIRNSLSIEDISDLDLNEEIYSGDKAASLRFLTTFLILQNEARRDFEKKFFD